MKSVRQRMHLMFGPRTREHINAILRSEAHGKHISDALKELTRKEKLRVAWGCPQQTRKRVITNRPLVYVRGRLRALGYKVVKGGRTALYTAAVRRHPLQEEAARRLGKTLLRDFTRGH